MLSPIILSIGNSRREDIILTPVRGVVAKSRFGNLSKMVDLDGSDSSRFQRTMRMPYPPNCGGYGT